jgi:hypothetical protein
MAATNKRLLIFVSRGDSNRCTPCREKPDQYDTYASHASLCMPDVRFLRAVTVRGNLSWVIDRFRRIPLLPRKRAPDTIYNTPVDRSAGVPSFSPKPTNQAIDLSQASVDDNLQGLLDPYHQYAISTFNTFTWVPTPRSLTDTGGGYQTETSE